MKEPNQEPSQQREQLLREIEQLARRALFGSISETYRTCGTPGCGCHRNGPKHGPHLYVSYRGDQGKTTGYYVPKAIQAEVRASIEAWSQLQDRLRRLARLNKEPLTATTRRKKRTFATSSSYVGDTDWYDTLLLGIPSPSRDLAAPQERQTMRASTGNRHNVRQI